MAAPPSPHSVSFPTRRRAFLHAKQWQRAKLEMIYRLWRRAHSFRFGRVIGAQLCHSSGHNSALLVVWKRTNRHRIREEENPLAPPPNHLPPPCLNSGRAAGNCNCRTKPRLPGSAHCGVQEFLSAPSAHFSESQRSPAPNEAFSLACGRGPLPAVRRPLPTGQLHLSSGLKERKHIHIQRRLVESHNGTPTGRVRIMDLPVLWQ